MSSTIESIHPQGITPLTADLIEPNLPQAISWFPDAPGWFVVAGLMIVYLGYRLYKRYRHYQANAYRREALLMLSSIIERNEFELLPSVIRKTALCAYPRSVIAPLVGKQWEQWLDAHCSGSDFCEKHSGLLSSLAYGAELKISQPSINALGQSIAHWISHHEVNHD